MEYISSPPVMQGEPSIYMLIGALQSAFWFFALPLICKPIWPLIFNQFTPQKSEMLLWLAVVPYFVMYVVFVALPPYLLNWEFFEQFKISKGPWPWRDTREEVRHQFWKLVRRSLVTNSMNLLVYLQLFAYMKIILLPSRALSFSVDYWPTHWESLIHILSSVLLHEFTFYWMHRLMHHPVLYKHHKVHHEYKQNMILSAQHFNPVDFTLSIAGPIILTSVLIRPHSFTQFQFGLCLFTTNLDDHLGYAFPWSPVRWFPGAASTDAHECHHSVNIGMYGHKLTLWDELLGTDKVYQRWRDKQWQTVKMAQ